MSAAKYLADAARQNRSARAGQGACPVAAGLARRLGGFALPVLLPVLLLGACAQPLETPPEPAVTSFTLVDASSDAAIAAFNPLRDGATVNLATYRAFGVRAHTRPAAVGSVRFDVGGLSHVDDSVPYALAPAGGWTPPPGSYRLSATVFPRPGALGPAGKTADVSFNVVDDDAPPDDPLAGGDRPTLLRRYYVLEYAASWQRAVAGLRYRPRAFGAAPYGGWDVLSLPGGIFRSYTLNEWLFLELSRPATLAVVWDGPSPAAWLSGWAEGPPLDGQRTFTKVFPAGRVVLGGIGGGVGGGANEPYTVLLAEADGTPAPAPTPPAGLEPPRPNASCPTWVHDRYLAEGHDAQFYRTWHPQIDPVYWCYFGHSHGSDPALFAGDVPVTFDYYADKGHRLEPHEGFKVFVINTDLHSLMFTAHLGSSEAGRVCARVHTYDMALAERRTGAVLADLRLKADFGYAMVIDEGSRFYRLKSPECPEMAALPDTAGGRVRVPLAGTSGYEPWNPSVQGNLLGVSNPPVLVIDNAMTEVEVARNPDGTPRLGADGFAEFLGVVPTGEAGERHWLSVPGGDVGRGFSVRAAAAAATGEFFTDYRGLTRLEPADPHAVRQFVAPGLDFLYHNDKIVFTQDAWQNEFETATGDLLRVDMNLEGGLGTPN